MSRLRREPVASVQDLIFRLKQILASSLYGPSDLIEALHALGIESTTDGQIWLAELEQEVVLASPIKAATASGIARVQLIRLLSVDAETRRLFADLGQRSGAIQRIVLRHLRAASERWAREYGPRSGWEERLGAALAPWAAEPGGEFVDIEREITAFLAGRHLPWPWLARMTVGAFTWYVDSVVPGLLATIGEPGVVDPAWRDAPPTPSDLPVLMERFWDDDDQPRLAEDRTFGPLHLWLGLSTVNARSELHQFVAEVEEYLHVLERPTAPVGALVDKRRPIVIRNVTWLYRHEVLDVSLKALASEEFDDSQRHADVRRGIATAHRLLARRPYQQPILTLDAYEARRLTGVWGD
jgi:hypothetical protein